MTMWFGINNKTRLFFVKTFACFTGLAGLVLVSGAASADNAKFDTVYTYKGVCKNYQVLDKDIIERCPSIIVMGFKSNQEVFISLNEDPQTELTLLGKSKAEGADSHFSIDAVRRNNGEFLNAHGDCKFKVSPKNTKLRCGFSDDANHRFSLEYDDLAILTNTSN